MAKFGCLKSFFQIVGFLEHWNSMMMILLYEVSLQLNPIYYFKNIFISVYLYILINEPVLESCQLIWTYPSVTKSIKSNFSFHLF